MYNISIPYIQHSLSYWKHLSALKQPNYQMFLTDFTSSLPWRGQRLRNAGLKHYNINVGGMVAEECIQKITPPQENYGLLEKPVAEKDLIKEQRQVSYE